MEKLGGGIWCRKIVHGKSMEWFSTCSPEKPVKLLYFSIKGVKGETELAPGSPGGHAETK